MGSNAVAWVSGMLGALAALCFVPPRGPGSARALRPGVVFEDAIAHLDAGRGVQSGAEPVRITLGDGEALQHGAAHPLRLARISTTPVRA